MRLCPGSNELCLSSLSLSLALSLSLSLSPSLSLSLYLSISLFLFLPPSLLLADSHMSFQASAAFQPTGNIASTCIPCSLIQFASCFRQPFVGICPSR